MPGIACKRRVNRAVATTIVCFVFCAPGAETTGVDERLAQYRNLGKAFYENPTTQAQAVEEFRKALDLAPGSIREHLNYGLALLRAGKSAEGAAQLELVQGRDPKLPHTWFNLGIYYKKEGDTRQAIEQFQRLAELVPQEPIAHYQLGTLYKIEGKREQARQEFERAAALNPLLAAARFQLYNLYRQAGRSSDAAQALAEFQRLKKQAEGAAVPEDVDWCVFAEIYDPPVASPLPAGKPALAEDTLLDGLVDPATAGLAAIDSTASGNADLLVWSSRGIALYPNGAARPRDAGLSGLRGVISVAPGDFDNDGWMDLCVLTESGPLLYRNIKGTFKRVEAALPKRRFERAVWID